MGNIIDAELQHLGKTEERNRWSDSLSTSLSPPTWPAKDSLDRSNEDVKIKIDFVTEGSLHVSEWVVACLACHYFLRST